MVLKKKMNESFKTYLSGMCKNNRIIHWRAVLPSHSGIVYTFSILLKTIAPILWPTQVKLKSSPCYKHMLLQNRDESNAYRPGTCRKQNIPHSEAALTNKGICRCQKNRRAISVKPGELLQ